MFYILSIVEIALHALVNLRYEIFISNLEVLGPRTVTKKKIISLNLTREGYR